MIPTLRRSSREPSYSPNGGVADSLDEAKAAFRGGGGASGIAGKSRREMLSLSPPTRTAVATPQHLSSLRGKEPFDRRRNLQQSSIMTIPCNQR
jgi:hypothetical protein